MAATNPSPLARSRRRFTDLTAAHFEQAAGAALASPGSEVAVAQQTSATAAVVSDHSTCAACGGLSFATFLQQREHFSSDFHKYNVRRRTRGRPPMLLAEFDTLETLDTASLGSLSGSEDGASDEDDHDELDSVGGGKAERGRVVAVSSGRLEFEDPVDKGMFLVVYKAALPDQETLASAKSRGSWAVIMSGGGHFAAAIWDATGNLTHHKTFHRYTSRAKQGGSQANADSASGRNIKSAGATLRRHGEQTLQNEVRSLLLSWTKPLESVQCVYVRVNTRERRDLLVGWEGSPLAAISRAGRIRTIPFPTRRATQKEATRVYDELMTVVVSATSATPTEEELEAAKVASSAVSATERLKRNAVKAAALAASRASAAAVPKEKGTAHLKKRSEKEDGEEDSGGGEREHEPEKEVVVEEAEVKEASLPLDDELLALFKACVVGDIAALEAGGLGASTKTTFHKGYYSEVEGLAVQTDENVGLVGAACAAGCVASINWLLDHGVSPTVGASPYLCTKSKAARTALRAYWGKHPDAHDYAGAGIPSALSDDDAARAAERKRKERLKKRDKKDALEDAAKPADVRAREARAAAAERRLAGPDGCAWCRTSLAGKVPFERLQFKYCSTDCVARHRATLAEDARKQR
jgi:Bacteroidetes VLRF1 release factor/Vms1-associating treble clef domain